MAAAITIGQRNNKVVFLTCLCALKNMSHPDFIEVAFMFKTGCACVYVSVLFLY